MSWTLRKPPRILEAVHLMISSEKKKVSPYSCWSNESNHVKSHWLREIHIWSPIGFGWKKSHSWWCASLLGEIMWNPMKNHRDVPPLARSIAGGPTPAWPHPEPLSSRWRRRQWGDSGHLSGSNTTATYGKCSLIPSGKLTYNQWKSTIWIARNLTVSMAIFNSKLLVITRGYERFHGEEHSGEFG